MPNGICNFVYFSQGNDAIVNESLQKHMACVTCVTVHMKLK